MIVPDYQLSLAIGKEGQNARLAARLTGWRVDIKSETQIAEEEAYARTTALSAEGEWIVDPETGEQMWQPRRRAAWPWRSKAVAGRGRRGGRLRGGCGHSARPSPRSRTATAEASDATTRGRPPPRSTAEPGRPPEAAEAR